LRNLGNNVDTASRNNSGGNPLAFNQPYWNPPAHMVYHYAQACAALQNTANNALIGGLL